MEVVRFMYVHLFRIKLNRSGYDSHGRYFGTGNPLYAVESDCGAIEYELRAYSRDDAKARVLAKHGPHIRFTRPREVTA